MIKDFLYFCALITAVVILKDLLISFLLIISFPVSYLIFHLVCDGIMTIFEAILLIDYDMDEF